MKVGTDGVLLGAWVSIENNPQKILDIGAGTGLIALQLAQRCDAEIDAVEVDENAFEQCVENLENSDWADRLFCYHATFQEFAEEMNNADDDEDDYSNEPFEKYDLLISNPPFYVEDFKTQSAARDLARFTDALPFKELIRGASTLLSETGTFALIIPRNEEQSFIDLASAKNLFPKRICRVRGSISSEEKRSLLEFSFYKVEPKIENLTIEIERHKYTSEYVDLVKDFYTAM